MQNLRDRPIRQKITYVIMLISGVVLLLAFAALFFVQAYALKQQSAHELAVVGEITAHNCASAVMFKDEGAAAEILAGLKTMPQIVSARLELMDQQRLAFFGGDGDELEIKAARLKSGFRIDGHRIFLAQPVMLGGKREGTLYLLADLQAMTSQLLKLYLGIFALVLAASLLLAFLLSSHFLRFITNPILRLAGTARTIADHKDYSVRADKVCGDEVGVLTDAFNQMLAQIESGDAALRESEERFRSVAESATDAIIITDGNELVLSWNKGAQVMFGYGESEFKGCPLSKIVAESYQAIYDAAMKRFREQGAEGLTGRTIELFGLRKDGTEFPFEMAMSTWTTASGTFFGGLIRDVAGRKTAEVMLRDSQQRLVETSRLAGMAEVATGVLHNVGNVLNSVNVSAGVVVDKLRRSKVPKLKQAAALIAERNGDLGAFLTHDPNGQKIPAYLVKLSQYLIEENEQLLTEVDLLARNIEHIKEVVAVQQSYAKVSGAFEDLAADQLVEDAIALNIGAFERHGIVLDRRFQASPLVRVDRHRVLQILINLLRNAKHALDDVQRIDKRITITIAPLNETQLRIAIADNGVGISEENIARIFGHGFTTKKDGHGFGLHSGALAAKEMGGLLSVQSLGPRRGATFSLDLPIGTPAPVTAAKL
jgi:PAS domain S-box-containing protein